VIIVTIHKGNPTAQDWAEIGKMIEDGFKAGIDRPFGINWEMERDTDVGKEQKEGLGD